MPDPSEQELQPQGERLVGFYRRDPSRRILRLALPSLVLTSVGALLLAWSWIRIEVTDPQGLYARQDALARQYGPPPEVRAPAQQVRHPFLRPSRAERRAAALRRRQALQQRLHTRGEERSAGAWAWVAFGLGFLLVAAGPLLLIGGLRRMWMRDTDFLLLRTDALIVGHGDARRTFRWEELERVRYEDDEVWLALRNGDDLALEMRFAGFSATQLAEHLENTRRKAVFQLLPQQRGLPSR